MLKMNDATNWPEKQFPPSVQWTGVWQGLLGDRHYANQAESVFGMCNSMRIRKFRKNPPLKDWSAVFADSNLCPGVYQFI